MGQFQNGVARLGRTAFLALAAWGGLSGVALAAACSAFSAETLMATNLAFNTIGNPNDGFTVPSPIEMASGDTLTVRVTWTRINAGAMTGVRVRSIDPNLTFDTTTAQPNNLNGNVTFGPYTATGNVAGAQVQVTAPTVTVTNGQVFFTCTPAPVGGGGGGGGSADFAALETIRSDIGRRSVFAGAAMLSDLLHASGSGPGVVTVDLGGGISAWSGLRGDILVPATGQWRGGQAVGAVGVTFTPAQDWLLGVFVGLEALNYDRPSVAQSLRGSGATLGGTVAFQLSDTWRIDGFAGISQLGYTAASNNVTGSYTGQRVFGEISITGDVPVGDRLRFEPVLGLIVLNERQSAFTDSAGTAHAAIDIGGLDAKAGGTLIFVVPAEFDLTLRLGGNVRANGTGASAQIDAGLSAKLGEAGLGTLGLSVTRLGSAQPALGLQGTLSLPF